MANKLNEKQELNNTIAIDLLLKLTSIITNLKMIIDINNHEQVETIIIEDKDYEFIQEDLVKIHNCLFMKYKELFNTIANQRKEEVEHGREENKK